MPVSIAPFVRVPDGKLVSRFRESKLKIILEVVSEPIDLVKKTSRSLWVPCGEPLRRLLGLKEK